ncbi:MAG TPA: ABC transporter substrate-binding protein [Bradyrhizobium sp.]|nr:ABC transporter substrate-binding protein [Bradyrhizobium sp.]
MSANNNSGSYGRRSVVTGLLGGIVLGAAPRIARAQEANTLRVTIQPGMGSLPFKVAQDQGLFEREGIKLQVTQGNDQTAYIQALDKQFDVVMLVMTTTVQAAAAGADIKVFGGMEALHETIPTLLIVSNKPQIQSMSDLAREGGTVALPRVTDLIKWLIEYDVRKKGLSVEKLNYVGVPFAEMGDQLRAGRVAAVLGAAGFFEPLLAEGFKAIARYPQEALLASGAKLPLSFAHFASSASFANKNPQVLAKFQGAIDQASKWIAANNDEARKIFADWLGANPNTVKNNTIPFYKVNVTEADVAAWLPLLSEGGLLKRKFEPNSLIPAVFGGK